MDITLWYIFYLWFSDVFRDFRKRPVAWNGSSTFKELTIPVSKCQMKVSYNEWHQQNVQVWSMFCSRLLINFNRYLPSELYVSIIHFTSTEPVKATLSTSMWLDIAAPAVGP